MSRNSVLILSDNAERRSIWADAFGAHGLESVCAGRPDDIGAEIPAALVLIDLSESVPEVLRVCRQLRSRSAAPILLVLPPAARADAAAAYAAGATECLMRPVSPAVILLKALAWSMRGTWAGPFDPSLPNLA